MKKNNKVLTLLEILIKVDEISSNFVSFEHEGFKIIIDEGMVTIEEESFEDCVVLASFELRSVRSFFEFMEENEEFFTKEFFMTTMNKTLEKTEE